MTGLALVQSAERSERAALLRPRWAYFLGAGAAWATCRPPALEALALARAESRAEHEGWWVDFERDEDGAALWRALLFDPDGDLLASRGGLDFAEAEGCYPPADDERLWRAHLAEEAWRERCEEAAAALARAAEACRNEAGNLWPSASHLPAHERLSCYAERLDRCAEGYRAEAER